MTDPEAAVSAGADPITPPGIDPTTDMRYRNGDDPMDRQAAMLTLHAGHKPWGENDGSLADTLRGWGLDPANFIESLDQWGYEIRVRAVSAGADPEPRRYEQINGVTYERKADGHLVVAEPEARAQGGPSVIDVERVGLQLFNALLGCDDRSPVQGWSEQHVIDHLRQAVEVANIFAPEPSTRTRDAE